MKKLMVIAVALLFMVPAFAFAEKTIDIGGTYYFWAWDRENYRSYDDNFKADDEAFIYSKLRVATTIKPADDITVYWRMDINEGDWGTGGAWPWSRQYGTGANIHFDYAWVNIAKEMGSLRVGHQFLFFGNHITLSGMAESIKLTITPPNAPVAITTFYIKDSEGGARNDLTGNDDRDIWGLNVGFKSEAFGLNVFAAQRTDQNTVGDDTRNVFGAQVTAQAGPVALNAEIDIYGGSRTLVGPDIKYKGQQLFFQAALRPMEQLMIAAQLLYAKGYTGANEVQLNNIGDVGVFSPYDYGIMHTEFNPLRQSGLHPFDLGASAGAQAINIIFDFTVKEGILIQGSLGWTQPEEDNNTVIDEAIVFNIGATFDIATNTKFGIQYNHIMIDDNKANGLLTDADDARAFMAALYLNF